MEADLEWYRRYCSAACVGVEAVEVPRQEALDGAVERLAQGDGARRGLYERVGRSLRSCLVAHGRWDGVIEEALPSALQPLHMPAVREALGALIPEGLHPVSYTHLTLPTIYSV